MREAYIFAIVAIYLQIMNWYNFYFNSGLNKALGIALVFSGVTIFARIYNGRI